MNLKGKRILVTGAAGFIGSALIRRALSMGIRVRGVDLRPLEIEHSDFEFVQGDAGNVDLYSRLLKGVELIVNTAAIVAERGDLDDFRRVNVDHPVRLARAARRAGVRGFFQFSSVMVYGFRYPAMVRETGPYGGHSNPYCQTKIESELALLNLHRPGAFEVFVVRPGDVYGPGSLPWVIRPVRLMRKRQFFLVDQGQGCMNHVYIDNLIDAVFLMIEKNASDRAYNVTDGARTTFEEYFTGLAGAAGLPVPGSIPAAAARLAGRAAQWFSGITGIPVELSAEAVDFVMRPHPVSIDSIIHLGFEPRIGLQEGLARTGQWLATADLTSQAARKPQLRVSRRQILAMGAVSLLAYLLFFPVDFSGRSWEPANGPQPPGLSANDRLGRVKEIVPAPYSGLEHVLVQGGTLYAAAEQGVILRVREKPEPVVETQGRPLGFAFDAKGQIWIADAFRGLLLYSGGKLRVMADEADGVPIVYADAVVAAKSGRIYFTDATNRFSAREHGTLKASILDVFEQSCTGRLIEYDPAQAKASVLLSGICFANGIALDVREESVFLAETGRARILRVFLSGKSRGASLVFLDNLPGYPDNIVRGRGRYWTGLVKPRSSLAEWLSDWPFVRKMIVRLPRFLWPVPEPYGRLIAFDENGRITADLHDPSGRIGEVTGAFESSDALYVSRLHGRSIGKLKPD